MKINNPRYKKQGIHVLASIFTIEDGILKVLLIQRKNEPYYNMWSLVGGALYNDETIEEALNREIFEKTGLKNVSLKLHRTYSRVDRSPLLRMVALSFTGFIDSAKVKLALETEKAKDIQWIPVDQSLNFELAYDHNEILYDTVKKAKKEITTSNLLQILFPEGVTLPEIQKIFEAVLDITIDRRNFRKKILSSEIIYDTGKTKSFQGKKPAKIYKFKEKQENTRFF